MAVRTDFVAGEVLAAQDLDDTFAAKVDYALAANAQSGTTYTFVLADATRLTTATSSSAKTLTIPPQSSVAWGSNAIIRVVNYGAGNLTIAGGSGVTVTNASKTLAQYESAALIRTGSNAWTLVPFSGTGDANFSNSATGTYTSSNIDYKYLTLTASGSVTFTRAGLADVLVLGAGGGGADDSQSRYGGGGSGVYVAAQIYVEATTYTVTIGAGGAGGGNQGSVGNPTSLGTLIACHGGGFGYASGGGPTHSGSGGLTGGYSNSQDSSTRRGVGSGGLAYGSNTYDGVASSITGSSVTYGVANTGTTTGVANRGEGGGAGANGGSGVVVVRVRT